MTSQFLPVFKSNAVFELAEMLPAIVDGDADFLTVIHFCRNYRIKGICTLFMDGVPKGLHLDLHKSGRAFLYSLKNMKDADKVTSKGQPFFDAIASNDLECAREIAKHSRLTWNNEEEYEDDFLYVFFLMKHFFLGGTDTENESIIQRYDQLLAGETDVQFDLCRAFFCKDNALFEKTLDQFLIERKKRFKKLVSTDSIPEEVAATEGNFCCEGLALVKLAETKGFKTQNKYLFIPSVARADVSISFDQEDWRNPLE